jgi:glyoxylase-like metal-dependent hydrolase (beta-lactamase superfamily II)
VSIQEAQQKPNSHLGSGRVRSFIIPEEQIRITQITTFCPDGIGPGPTHLYVIEGDSIILMDTGIPTHLVKAFLYSWRNLPIPSEVERLPSDYSEQEFLKGLELARYSLKDIEILVVSHGHPDHFLMGPQILRRTNPRVVAHILDTSEICNPWAMLRQWVWNRPQLMGMGMPMPNSVKESKFFLGGSFLEDFSLNVDDPVFSDGPIQVKGSPIKGITVKHLPGHSPGSIGLIVGKKEKVLLCGDVLLSPISPHPDDLLLYLRTLEELGKMENISLVLPSHGRIIRDLKGRVATLQKHHRRRLQLTYEACQKPCSVWDIATIRSYYDVYVDSREFNPLAGREALAHIEILIMIGGLQRSHVKDGIHYFRNSGEPFEEVYQRVLGLVQDRRISPLLRY